MSTRPVIALYGGSFDPVHCGHVAVVSHVMSALYPARFSLIPCQIPPHKRSLHASSRDRLAMLSLAFAGVEGIDIDQRELRRDEISYSFDTASQIRDEVGTDVSLVFVIGWDSWLNFTTWHRWRDLLSLVNLLVVTRPGAHRAEGADRDVLEAYLRERSVAVDCLANFPRGRVAMLENLHMDIASNKIRACLARGESIDAWVPRAVLRYIRDHHIYDDESRPHIR